MKIQDHIHFRGNQWVADFTYRTRKSPERNYGTGTTHYMTFHKTGWEAVTALSEYCQSEGIEFTPLDGEWESYYKSMDRHISYMNSKKGLVPQGEWDMAFSCDAPNKPGYFRANND